MSSVDLTCGPSPVITRNLASGSLSPTWIVIFNSPLNWCAKLWLGARYNMQACGNGNGFIHHRAVRRMDASSRGRSRFLVAQLPAQDLADIGLGQLGPELDPLRHLVVGQLLVAELDHLLGGEFGGLLDDERLHDLARLF